MQSFRKLFVAGGVSALALVGAGAALAAPANVGGVNDDASHVVFTTTERMVPEDLDAAVDVYERTGGTTRLVSVGPVGGNAQLDASFQGISDNGSRIAFETTEQLTADDTDTRRDVYIREDGQTERASQGANPNVGNGAFDATVADVLPNGSVVIETDEKLDVNDTDPEARDVYLYNQSITMLSRTTTVSPGNQNEPFDASYEGQGGSGAFIYFSTREDLSANDNDTNNNDIYVSSLGGREIVSDSADGGDESFEVTFGGVAGGGDVAVFETAETWSAADTDGDGDVYSYDITSDAPTFVTIDFDAEDVDYAGVAETGTEVYVETVEALAAGDDDTDIDVYEVDGAAETGISIEADGAFDASFVGADGAGDHAAWSSPESVAGAEVDNAAIDIYETEGNTVRLISTGPQEGAELGATFRGYAEDGSRVLFSTREAMTAGDTDDQADVYARIGESSTSKVTPGNGPIGVIFGAASADATALAYRTDESLVPADPDAEADVYKSAPSGTTLESHELVPPDTTITEGVPAATTDTTPTFAFSSSEPASSFECSFDAAPFTPCGVSSALGDGPHTFAVRAIDAPGNVDPTPASQPFKVDTQGPAVKISGRARRANRRGAFKVALTCPAGETGGCSGRLILASAKALKVGRNKRRFVVFVSNRFSLEPGQTKAIQVKLSRKNRGRLRRLRKVRLSGRATAQDGLGNERTSAGKLTLKAPRRR